MRRLLIQTLITAILVGCTERKPPFSRERFLAARWQCGATDAYIFKAAPNTIGFHGTAYDHTHQAKCLTQRLAGTDVEVVVLGSTLYQ